MQNKNIDYLNKQEYNITLIISEITQIISDLRELLESKDIYNVCAYKSRNAEFRRLSIEFKFSVPSFILLVRVSLHRKMQFSNTDLCKALLIRYDSQIITTF